MPNDKHLSDEQIDALLKEVGEREVKATPGPWQFEWPDVTKEGHYESPKVFSVADPNEPKYLLEIATGRNEEGNGVFIAAARSDIPALRSVIAQLRQQRDTLLALPVLRVILVVAGLHGGDIAQALEDKLRAALADWRKANGE